MHRCVGWCCSVKNVKLKMKKCENGVKFQSEKSLRVHRCVGWRCLTSAKWRSVLATSCRNCFQLKRVWWWGRDDDDDDGGDDNDRDYGGGDDDEGCDHDDGDFQKVPKDTNKVQKVPNIIQMHLMMGSLRWWWWSGLIILILILILILIILKSLKRTSSFKKNLTVQQVSKSIKMHWAEWK